jgi:hypothetical protein
MWFLFNLAFRTKIAYLLCCQWNKWSCKLYLEGKVQLRHFYKKQIL